MLYSVHGKLIVNQSGIAVIECGGVGFNCRITMTTARRLPALGEQTTLNTVMNVRDDAIELFGFTDRAELNCFKQLTSVTGIGPKAALSILSELSPERVAMAIASGDYKTLTCAQGIGPKLAQRIVLELKDKFGALQTSDLTGAQGFTGVQSASGNATEAVNALTVLGFSVGESSSAVGRLDSSLPVDTLVREALKSLAKRG